MNAEFRLQRLLFVSAASAVVLVACGGDSKSHTVPSYLGVTCGDVWPVTPTEVDVQEMAAQCAGAGVCLHAGDVAGGATESAGMCSCRCAGPAGAGAFCSCGDGFDCREEVRDLGVTDAHLVGSYCVPSE